MICLLVLTTGIHDNRQLISTSMPVSEDKGQQGLSALQQWINEKSIPAQVLQSGYDSLTDKGNTLISVLPATIPPGPKEQARLSDWVRQGNHLILLLAVNDTPHWRNKLNIESLHNTLNRFDLELVELPSGDTQEDIGQSRVALESRINHPLTHNLHSLSVVANRPIKPMQLLGKAQPTSSIILLREKQSQIPVAWHTLYGNGHITLFTVSSLFANQNMDNPQVIQLFENMINFYGNNASRVIFDDIHHVAQAGISIEKSVYMHPLLLLLVGYLLYLLINRIISQKPFIPEILYLRRKNPRLYALPDKQHFAQRISTLWFNIMRQRRGLPCNSKPIWDDFQSLREQDRNMKKIQRIWNRLDAQKKIRLNGYIRKLEKSRKSIL